MTAATATAQERPEGFWDGKTHAYLPSAELKIPPSLRLNTATTDDLDPITYEVVRYGLWNANGEHGKVIENLAVSPIAVEIRDFQTCILTEDARLLYFGPYLQYMAGQLDLMVKYVIERRGDQLRPGDMWLCNDPIIGTAHQPDVCLMCPVFHADELFCWVANVCHQNDIGGIVPGSFCPNAEDTFSDPPSFPPIRIVRDDRIEEDLEEVYRRASRTPVNLSLDLRATVAGNLAARKRILALVDQYGPAVVKGTMHRVMAASERAFEHVLDTIPDGVYSERILQEVAVTGDRGTYPVCVNAHKQGRRIVFDNVGTHPQVGAINVAFAGWRGSALGAINVLMLADQLGCIAGALRYVEFAPEPGTITCPDWGAAVSAAGLYGTHIATSLSSAVVSKMMLASSDEQIRGRALSTEMSQWGCHFTSGTNQRGDFYVGGQGDTMIGATGATWRRDGEFANGHYWIPDGRGPNVELYERDWPILYLFRREHPGSAGAGRFRAGNGGELAYVPHRGTSSLDLYGNEGIPKTNGLFGGGPGATITSLCVIGSDVQARFAAGELPQSLDELRGERRSLEGKGDGFPVTDDDVLYWNWAPPGGYGDPLTRDLDRLDADLRDGAVTHEVAVEVYGAVLTSAGGLDHAATAARREALRREVVGGPIAPPIVPPAGAETIGDVYWIDRDRGCLRCHACGADLGRLGADPKRAMVMAERPVDSIMPRMQPLAQFVDEDVVWRDFRCPGCGVRMATEVAIADSAPFQELELR